MELKAYNIGKVLILMLLGAMLYHVVTAYQLPNKVQINESLIEKHVLNKSTREEFSVDFQKFVLPIVEKFDTMFTMPNKDMAILLNILAISETSSEATDGYYYVLNSTLSTRDKALFGIQGGNTPHKTWELINGVRVDTTINFRSYDTYTESVEYWFEFIRTVKKGNKLRYKEVMEAKSWAEGLLALKNCGYMTDEAYPNKGYRIYNNHIKPILNDKSANKK